MNTISSLIARLEISCWPLMWLNLQREFFESCNSGYKTVMNEET